MESMDVEEGGSDTESIAGHCCSAGESFSAELFTKFIAQMYLMFEAQLFLPETSVQTICESLTTISELVQEQMRCLFTQELQILGVSENDITGVFNRVFTSDAFYNAHHKNAPGPVLTSDHHRRSFFKENFLYVEPEEIPLDSDYLGGETLYYISIRQTLEMLLKDPSFDSQLESSFERLKSVDPDVYSDYYTGNVCSQRPYYKEDRIDLLFYQDAFSANPNPLGSAKTKYKVVSTYFTVGNMEPHIRAKVSSIHLVMLCHEKLLKDPKYGPDGCFHRLIEELKSLAEEGILYKNKKIRVFAQYFICDNLGAHELGGFIQSFSGVYFCRFCEVQRAEFKNDPCIKKPLRSPDSYEEALQQLREIQAVMPSKNNHRGITRQSEINKLPDRHVCDPSLPPCIGHDLFENGVVDVDFSAIIHHLVTLKWFSYDLLTRRIQEFKYLGSDRGNKPARIKGNGDKLGGHAVQNWTLLRLFPLIIEGLIKDSQNEFWRLYLKLRSVVEVVCAPKLTKAKCQELEHQTNDYLRAREIIGKAPKPKHHFLSHYSSLVPLFGPLIHLWTLRAESKHAFFKRLARTCNNYKNIIWTLSTRHQMFLAYLCTGMIFKAGLNDAKTCDIASVDSDLKNFIDSHSLSGYECCNSVTFDEVEYKVDHFVFLTAFDPSLEEMYVGQIRLIFWLNNALSFVVNKIKVTNWDEFGILKLEENDGMSLMHISQCSLTNPVPHPVYEFQDKLCISLKHIII